MSIGIVGAAYIAAAVLFILALGGLSGQESAKRAVWYGIAGMALAVGATVLSPNVANVWVIALMVIVTGILLPALQATVAILCIASVMLGTGFMLIHVAINNAVGHASAVAHRPQAFAILALGFSTSSILGPVISGLTIDHLGYAATFVILAVFPALAFCVLLLTRRNHQEIGRAHV